MYSNFESLAENLCRKRKVDVTSFQASNLRSIERDLDSGKISAEEAVSALEEKFSYRLDKYDYKDLEKELERKLK